MDMDLNQLKKECMGIVNQLFDLAEVGVEKRQAINDIADKYLFEQILRLKGLDNDIKKMK